MRLCMRLRMRLRMQTCSVADDVHGAHGDVAVFTSFGEIEFEQGLKCGELFGLLFRWSPARLEAARADFNADFEALRVIRPLFIEHEVLGRLVEHLLRRLLECGFEVGVMFRLRRVMDT